MDRTILKRIGLTENEIEIYLTLLKSGSISVNSLAEKSGVHRRAIYDTLERLLEKGFASYVIKNNKKYFQAASPEKVLDYLKNLQENFETLMPDLISLTKLSKEESKVEVFKGKEVLRIILKDKIKTLIQHGEENLVFGVDERIYEALDPIILNQFINQLQKHNIKERIIVKEGTNFFLGGKTSDYRTVSASLFSPTPTHCYANKVAFLVFGNPLMGIIIENEQVAESYRKQFNILWNNAKKINWRKYKKK